MNQYILSCCSTCDITAQHLKDINVEYTPFHFFIDGKEYKDDLGQTIAYEDFYRMAEKSSAFRAYCREAFGADFSQDGFSDLWQVEQILPYIPRQESCRKRA